VQRRQRFLLPPLDLLRGERRPVGGRVLLALTGGVLTADVLAQRLQPDTLLEVDQRSVERAEERLPEVRTLAEDRVTRAFCRGSGAGRPDASPAVAVSRKRRPDRPMS
jgi:hypothetical protein